jgi:DNA-binding transcriptional LysR family regulator
VICGSPQYFRKFGRPKTPQDLREHNCLADLYSGPKSWPFRNSPRPLLVEVKGSLSSNSSAVLIRMALNGSGIIRVPLHAVQKEIADKKLDVIFKNVALSPERMSAYCARAKRLPAKTADFISFLKTSLRHHVNG